MARDLGRQLRYLNKRCELMQKLRFPDDDSLCREAQPALLAIAAGCPTHWSNAQQKVGGREVNAGGYFAASEWGGLAGSADFDWEVRESAPQRL